MSKSLTPDMDAIVAALSAVRTPARPEEYDIHAAVARALDAAGLAYEHEYRLGPRRRVDFRVGRVGIEVKKGRPASSQLREQLRRYLEADALDAMIVVTQRMTALPDVICGKPVALVSLNRLWGVALP
ncbi:MAG: hypothetical protein IJH09_02865 [Clostridia bacterium]|nr:hypothetical protein [Clostridia bacterium]